MYVDEGCSRVIETVPLQATIAPHPFSRGKKGRSMTRRSDKNCTLDDKSTHMGTSFQLCVLVHTMCLGRVAVIKLAIKA